MRFSLTMPSEAAKNVRTCKIKWRSLPLSLFVQKDASGPQPCCTFARSMACVSNERCVVVNKNGSNLVILNGKEHEAMF